MARQSHGSRSPEPPGQPRGERQHRWLPRARERELHFATRPLATGEGSFLFRAGFRRQVRPSFLPSGLQARGEEPFPLVALHSTRERGFTLQLAATGLVRGSLSPQLGPIEQGGEDSGVPGGGWGGTSLPARPFLLRGSPLSPISLLSPNLLDPPEAIFPFLLIDWPWALEKAWAGTGTNEFAPRLFSELGRKSCRIAIEIDQGRGCQIRKAREGDSETFGF